MAVFSTDGAMLGVMMLLDTLRRRHLVRYSKRDKIRSTSQNYACHVKTTQIGGTLNAKLDEIPEDSGVYILLRKLATAHLFIESSVRIVVGRARCLFAVISNSNQLRCRRDHAQC